MPKFGSICVVTGVLYAVGGTLAADGQNNQVVPDFALPQTPAGCSSAPLAASFVRSRGDIQEMTVVAAVLSKTLGAADAGKAFVRFLKSPEASLVVKKTGLEPD